MNNIETLDLDLAVKRYGDARLNDICFMRSIALKVDADPYSMQQHRETNTVQFLCSDRDWDTLTRTVVAESLSYGDAGAFLASPNPALCGGLIKHVASDEHQKYFFDYVAKNHCTTFAAITEPGHGSDIANIETKLEKGSDNFYYLNGGKCFITHGADGEIGVVVARTAAGPFGITSVLVTAAELQRGEAAGTITRKLLPIIGLKGTFLSQINFNNFAIPVENVLGQHLRPIYRGMMAIIKTFNQMRPTVAGFVLGQAQAIVDYVQVCYKKPSLELQHTLAKLNADLASSRKSLYNSARLIDLNPLESSYVSLTKAQVTNLIERICWFCSEALDQTRFYEHPLLLKWCRDAFGFEYMEGTTNMQKRNVYQKHLKKGLRSVD